MICETPFPYLKKNTHTQQKHPISLAETRDQNEAFSSSLLLANSPMSPRIVNGSFAAICDDLDGQDFVAMDYAGNRMAVSKNIAFHPSDQFFGNIFTIP